MIDRQRVLGFLDLNWRLIIGTAIFGIGWGTPLGTLLQDLVSFLSQQQDTKATLRRLMHWLRTRRCLLTSDSVKRTVIWRTVIYSLEEKVALSGSRRCLSR